MYVCTKERCRPANSARSEETGWQQQLCDMLLFKQTDTIRLLHSRCSMQHVTRHAFVQLMGTAFDWAKGTIPPVAGRAAPNGSCALPHPLSTRIGALTARVDSAQQLHTAARPRAPVAYRATSAGHTIPGYLSNGGSLPTEDSNAGGHLAVHQMKPDKPGELVSRSLWGRDERHVSCSVPARPINWKRHTFGRICP